MAIRPRNCVFVSGYCRDDGHGEQGPCIASYHLTGAIHAPLLQILVVEEWGGAGDWNRILDIARNGNYLYVLVGVGDRISLTNTTLTANQWRGVRLYAVDVTDPAAMTLLPGYLDLAGMVEPYVIAQPSYQVGFYGVTQMQCASDILGFAVIQGYYDNHDKMLDWFFFDLRRSAWPLDLETGLTSRLATYWDTGTIPWKLRTGFWETSLSKSPCGWAAAERKSESEAINVVRAEPTIIAGYGGGTYGVARVVRRAPTGLVYGDSTVFIAGNTAGTAAVVSSDMGAFLNEEEFSVADIENWPHSSVERYEDPTNYGYAFTYPYQLAYACAVAHEQDDDVLIWVATPHSEVGGARVYGWSWDAGAVIYQRAWDFNVRFIDMDVAGNHCVAAKVYDDLGTMPNGYPRWSGWELWDTQNIARTPVLFPSTIRGITRWPAGGAYDIRMIGYGIVAGVPVQEELAVDAFTDPTGIQWTAELDNGNLSVQRPETPQTFAPAVFINNPALKQASQATGSFGSVSITGDGTVLTVEAQHSDNRLLHQWRSYLYGVEGSWGYPFSVVHATVVTGSKAAVVITPSAATDTYVGRWMIFTSGDNNGSARKIAAYDEGTGTATFAVALSAEPAVNDTVLIGGGRPRVIWSGQVNSYAASKIVAANIPDVDNDYFNGHTLTVTSGLNAKQTRRITDFDAGAKSFTIDTVGTTTKEPFKVIYGEAVSLDHSITEGTLVVERGGYVFEEDVDYEVDYAEGTITAIEGGAMDGGLTYWASYNFSEAFPFAFVKGDSFTVTGLAPEGSYE